MQTNDKTLIFRVVPKSNPLAPKEYIRDLKDEYIILKTIEITPTLDEEGIQKFIEGCKKKDYEKLLKMNFEIAHGIPYGEEHREVAEKLLARRSEPSEYMKRVARRALGIEEK